MNLKLLKKIITARVGSDGYQVCANNNTNYVYVINEDRVVIFSSDSNCIRFNKALNDEEGVEEVKDFLKELAGKLGRKYLEAEWPTTFMANRQLNSVKGNWNPKVLAPLNGAYGARGVNNTIINPINLREFINASTGQIYALPSRYTRGFF